MLAVVDGNRPREPGYLCYRGRYVGAPLFGRSWVIQMCYRVTYTPFLKCQNGRLCKKTVSVVAPSPS